MKQINKSKDMPANKFRTAFDKHAKHEGEIRACDNMHIAYYHCLKCNKWAGWVGYKHGIVAWDLGLVKEEQVWWS